MSDVTFFAGEELEFKMGRYKENLTLDQAIQFYKTLDTCIGIKGIGICYNDMEWTILSGNAIMQKDLDFVPEIKELEETQEAINILKKQFPDYKII